MALTAAGVGSGIDVEGILSQLAEIEQQPVVVLNEKLADLDVELSAFGRVKSALQSFQESADALGSDSDFGGFAASSSDEDVFTATASSNASLAVNADVEVLSLATSHRLASAAYASENASVETGTLTFTSGDNSFDVVVDSSNNTLLGLRDAINEELLNSSVSASIINVDGGTRLILTGKNTGTEGIIDVTRNGGGLLGNTDSGFEEVTEAVDASLIVHGFNVTRSSNTISDVIDGVTLELKGVGTSTVDSRRDLTTLKTAMDDFVTKYNEMSSTLTSIGRTDLQGDQLPRGIDQRMRAVFLNTIELDNGDSATALQMGLSFDRNGALSLDPALYESALEDGVDRYVDVFANAETGLVSLFSNLVDEYTIAGGIIDIREDGVDTRKSSIDSQIERLEYRIEITNDRLRRQFTAMDLAVSNLQSTSSFLTSRLSLS
jgi:flagellar hook-associated protein 2